MQDYVVFILYWDDKQKELQRLRFDIKIADKGDALVWADEKALELGLSKIDAFGICAYAGAIAMTKAEWERKKGAS